jgi:hypothetical protein
MADEPAAEPSPTPSGTPAAPSPAADASASIAATPPADPAKPAAEPAPAAPATPVIPEKYDFKALKLPDGVKLDEPLLKDMEPVFKELGLTQENASKLVEMHAKTMAAVEMKKEADFVQYMADKVKGNEAALRKELGPRYQETIDLRDKALGKLTNPENGFMTADERKEFLTMLEDTALLTMPTFVKMMSRIGKMVSEDTPPATHVAASRKSLDERLYPNMPRSN